MQLNFHTKGFSLTDTDRGIITSNLRFILGRYGAAIKEVDINLVRLVIDSAEKLKNTCQIDIKISESKTFTEIETEADIYDAIQYCAYRMRRTLNHHFSLQEKMGKRIIATKK